MSLEKSSEVENCRMSESTAVEHLFGHRQKETNMVKVVH